MSYDNLHGEATEYIKNKDYESCLYVLNRIEEMHGVTSELQLQKGIVLYRLGEIMDAITSLEQSLSLDPENKDAAILLPRLKQRLENLRQYCMVQLYS